jgi:hypothetical protein
MVGLSANFSSIRYCWPCRGRSVLVQTFVRTALAASLGAIIGQQFDGVFPVARFSVAGWPR